MAGEPDAGGERSRVAREKARALTRDATEKVDRLKGSLAAWKAWKDRAESERRERDLRGIGDWVG